MAVYSMTGYANAVTGGPAASVRRLRGHRQSRLRAVSVELRIA
jgi:hypothetical protein